MSAQTRRSPAIARRSKSGLLVALLSSLVLSACSGGGSSSDGSSSQSQAFDDPPEVAVGERLFLETRFAEFFAVNSPANVNQPLTSGDPALARLPTADGSGLAGPFAGQSMNCRQCHLVDEAFGVAGGGNRTYSDFARRSVLTDRGDEPALTVRNSPGLVDSTLARSTDFILHGDGEFTSIQELVSSTITGRMAGWLPTEQAQAAAHIARVIREDDGRGDLAADAGGSYRAVLSGTSSSLLLPPEYRINVNTATDQQIVEAVSKLIGAYVDSLSFVRNTRGVALTSPYDLFLGRNNLPAAANFGESDLDYARRLRAAVEGLATPSYVPADVLRKFQFHAQPFQFNESELRGLRIFLREPASASGLSPAELASGGVGNCVSCHAPPQFTDFGLHNTGVTQIEYDGIHGNGALAGLDVPSLADRATPAVAQANLPKTNSHPDYESRMRSIPVANDPLRVDLGAWNTFANSDFPLSQTALRNLLCNIVPATTSCASLSDDSLLTRAVGVFKTPSLRDLADSQPYMHNGQFDGIEDVVNLYVNTSALARAGTLRNADPRLGNIAINAQDQADLAAFLRALNEDYN